MSVLIYGTMIIFMLTGLSLMYVEACREVERERKNQS